MGTSFLDFVFSAAGRVIVWSAKVLVKAGIWAVREIICHPRSSSAVAVIGAAALLVDWRIMALVVGGVLLAGSIWKAAHGSSFDRVVVSFLRTWSRRWGTYRRQWKKVLGRCELVIDTPDGPAVPRLTKVSTNPFWDRLEIRMEIGQDLETWESAAQKLRHSFKAERVTVREIKPAAVGVDLMRRDALVHVPIAASPIPATTADINFSALPIGMDEHCNPYTVSVVGGHLAVAGVSGAGKASAEWNILRSLAPAIADGTVEVIAIDPKLLELKQGLPLFKHYAATEEETLALLQKVVEMMNEAKESAASSGERDFVPSKRRPLRLILIDEMAPLFVYWKRSTRDKIEDLLGLILTQGRAVGFLLVGEIQEVTKDVFKQRDLFQRRIALRMPTADYTDAILTDNASERGALCHRIPENMPGTFFSLESGASTAVRARLGWVRNEDIRELVEYVKSARVVTSLDQHRDHDRPAIEAA